jgi:hypothetical protein
MLEVDRQASFPIFLCGGVVAKRRKKLGPGGGGADCRGRAAQISWRFTLTSRNLIIKSGKGGEGGVAHHPPSPAASY